MVCACVALPTHVRTTSALHLVRSFLKFSITFKRARFGSADGLFAGRGGAFALLSRAYDLGWQLALVTLASGLELVSVAGNPNL